MASRFGHLVWGNVSRRRFDDKHWQEPVLWHKAALRSGQRVRVFCASMADVFEDHPDRAADRHRLWQLIDATPMLDWLLLTKRPEQIVSMAPWPRWPDSVWALTSVETQDYAERRIPHLLSVPAGVRGLSVEPLLESVDLSSWLADIDWVIVGGESGRHARPMSPDWVWALRDQCVAAGVPFFFKQWGNRLPDGRWISKHRAGRELDGRTWDQVPENHDAKR